MQLQTADDRDAVLKLFLLYYFTTFQCHMLYFILPYIHLTGAFHVNILKRNHTLHGQTMWTTTQYTYVIIEHPKLLLLQQPPVFWEGCPHDFATWLQ